MIEPYNQSELMRSFDRAFEQFRRNFEDMLWPSQGISHRMTSLLPGLAENMPLADLEDRGDDYCLTVEVPGFKKEDIEIEVEENAVEVRGSRMAKESEKSEGYVHKERASQSFHRRIELPEDIVTNKVEANMNDGVLELVMPKKNPKPRTRINIK